MDDEYAGAGPRQIAGMAYDVIIVPLPELIGFYASGQVRTAAVGLGLSLVCVHEVRIQSTGALVSGVGHGDGVELPADYWFDWPTQLLFRMDPPGTGWWSASVGPYDGSFSSDDLFVPHFGATWDVLLNGQAEVEVGLAPLIILGGVMVIPPAGQLDDANLIIVGVVGGAADLNHDAAVDARDLAQMLAVWGPCAEPCIPGDPAATCAADLDGDCVVHADDLAELLSSWGHCE